MKLEKTGPSLRVRIHRHNFLLFGLLHTICPDSGHLRSIYKRRLNRTFIERSIVLSAVVTWLQ